MGWGGLLGKVSMGERGEIKGKGEGRGTYTPLSALPLNNINIHPKQLWPKCILGILLPVSEVGVNEYHQSLVAANCINVLQAGAIGKFDQLL